VGVGRAQQRGGRRGPAGGGKGGSKSREKRQGALAGARRASWGAHGAGAPGAGQGRRARALGSAMRSGRPSLGALRRRLAVLDRGLAADDDAPLGGRWLGGLVAAACRVAAAAARLLRRRRIRRGRPAR
jgi:hypothetical protein